MLSLESNPLEERAKDPLLLRRSPPLRIGHLLGTSPISAEEDLVDPEELTRLFSSSESLLLHRHCPTLLRKPGLPLSLLS